MDMHQKAKKKLAELKKKKMAALIYRHHPSQHVSPLGHF
jgi:hypothetical protein